MSIIAIVQARMGSQRLPGKVLQDIDGVSMLARVIQRLRKVSELKAIVIATTDKPEDDAIVVACSELQCAVFRGSELDVLSRYYQCAVRYQADSVLRVTSDCPLLDPAVTSSIIQAFLTQKPDYASNCLQRSYPRGLDVEVMTLKALQSAYLEAHETYQREHVTPYIYQHPEQFKLLPVMAPQDNSHHRWTVDEPADLEMIRMIYQNFTQQAEFTYLEVLELLKQKPEIARLNQHVQQKIVSNL